VQVSPPADWVSVRAVDWDYSVHRGGQTTLLLIDRQHHAELRAAYHRRVERLETLHAVHQAAKWTLDYDPQTQRPTVHSVTIHRGAEVIDHADSGRFRLLRREPGLEDVGMTGSRTTLVLPLEDIRDGDCLDVSYTLEHTAHIASDRYAAMIVCPSVSFVREFHVSVRFAGERPLKWLSGPLKQAPVTTDHSGEIQWSWVFEKTGLADPETDVPPWPLSQQWIQVSDWRSWEEVGGRVHASWKENFEGPLLTETAEQIAADNPEVLDRVEAAIRFVQDDVRHLGKELGSGGYIPAAPERILRQRAGDSKDTSFLLAHLLRRLGVPARPVFVHSLAREHVREFLPMLEAFDHVVVEIGIDGHRRTVDPTTPLQGGGPLKRFVTKYGVGLPITSEGRGLEPLPHADRFDFGYELHETFYLDTAGGPTLLRIRVHATGREADTLRAALALEGRESFSHRREQLYRHLFPEVRRVRAVETVDDRADNVIELSEAYELVGAVARTSDRRLDAFDYPSPLLRNALSLPEGGKRRQPLAIPFPCRFQHDIEIECAAINPEEAMTRVTKDSAFRLSVDTHSRSGKISCRLRLQTFEGRVEPERYPQFRRRVEEAWRSMEIHLVIPVGVAQPRRRMPAQLLSSNAGIKRPDSAHTTAGMRPKPSERSSSDSREVRSFSPLPASPAPPLTSAADASSTPEKENRELQAVIEPPAEPPLTAERAEEVGTRPTGRRHSSRRRSSHSRRRHRGGFQRHRLMWGVLACLAMICVVIVIALLTRH
jgi:hypothetical protein